MKPEEQRRLVTVWNEIEEVNTDLRDMTLEELQECNKCMRERLEYAMKILDDMIDEKYFQEVIN